MFAAVSGKWPSEHLLPWIVRLAGRYSSSPALCGSGRPPGGPTSAGRFTIELAGPVLPGRLPLRCWPPSSVLALTYLVLEPFPHIEDEAAHYFQARIFASGHLFAPAPASPEFFPSSWMMLNGGRWFSVFPAGWPLLLAIGMKVGAPALVDPRVDGTVRPRHDGLIREMMTPSEPNGESCLRGVAVLPVHGRQLHVAHGPTALHRPVNALPGERRHALTGSAGFWRRVFRLVVRC